MVLVGYLSIVCRLLRTSRFSTGFARPPAAEGEDSCYTKACSADLCACDRAGANRVCEDGMYSDAGERVNRMRLLCFAHLASTSTGRGIAALLAYFKQPVNGPSGQN